MMRYLPILLGVLLIVGLTIPQIRMTDRLAGSNISAEQRAELLKLVPQNFGDWHSEDKPLDPNVKQGAGSIGMAVSREYRNSRTGERVDLWLIVGHARDISAHTPDICYPASGFEARAKENALFPLVAPGVPETPFLTNTFYRESELTGRQLIRVFWTWYNPEAEANDGKVVWDAPQNARWHFGNTRALYKMYFTSAMRDPMETAEQSPCVHFAKDFLPEVGKALNEVHHHSAEASSNSTGEAPAASPPAAPAGEATPAENATPVTEAPANESSTTAPSTEQTPAETPKAQ